MDTYTAYSSTEMNRLDIEPGNKSTLHVLPLVILPPEALERLTRLNAESPMLFRITVASTRRKVFCGVLEFVADHNTCYLPNWMMQHLLISEGDNILIANVKLPKGNYMRIQPFTTTFASLTNPKAA